MAKILAYQTPAMGHFFPISVLLTELRNRGHDVTLRTLAAGVETGLGMGFATAPVDPRIEAMQPSLGSSGAPSLPPDSGRRLCSRPRCASRTRP
jgi:hypothetical protein